MMTTHIAYCNTVLHINTVTVQSTVKLDATRSNGMSPNGVVLGINEQPIGASDEN